MGMVYPFGERNKMRRMKITGNSSHLGSLVAMFVGVVLIATAFLASSAEAQDAGQTLFNYPDTALNGITSAEISKSPEECRKICSSRPGCAGFDHSEKGMCRIFASVGSGKTVTGALSETRSLINGYHEPTNPPLAGRFEKLKQTDNDGDELAALSRDAFAQGDRDIGNQAIQLAMQRGNTEAKLEIAKWYDPRTFKSDRAAAIDTNKAARSYFELALEGNSDAVGLLTSLCREASNSSSAFTSSFESFLGSTYCEGSLNP
ncbi:PAN domain-containing protein [Rhizobium giardinii]|uniref:PAN domain-containing protein n=1 Tax=Rhizobium giardinii TaxID=56731 RepID=UPI003D6E0801